MRNKLILFFILFNFLLNSLVCVPLQASEIILPSPGVKVSLSPAYNPPVLKGIKLHPEKLSRLDFLFDQGEVLPALRQQSLKQESNKLIKYFLTSLTIPEKDLWVNLSPYEKNRIV